MESYQDPLSLITRTASGLKIKLRKACREIVALSFIAAVILFAIHYQQDLYYARLAEKYNGQTEATSVVWNTALPAMIMGSLYGFCAWLLYRFARFIIGR